MRNKKSPVYHTGSRYRRNLCSADLYCQPAGAYKRRNSGASFRGAHNPAGIYSGGNSGTGCRLCHLQHTDRCCNMGCYLRKPCHTHRSGWHISSEKASQDTVPPSAHNCQYCYSTACTDLCLRRAGRIMVLGADGMCR